MVPNAVVDNASWLRRLARWSLLAALAYLVLFVLFFAEFPLMQNSPLPDIYNDLVLASRSAALARTSIMLSMCYWLLIGGFFVVAGTSFTRLAFIRGSLIAVLGVGQLLGMLGNVLQLNSVGGIAADYMSAAPAQQPVLLRSFADLRLVYTSAFELAGILWALALLILASASWSTAVFPPWLSILMAVAGIGAVVNFAAILVAGKYDAPVAAELLLMIAFLAAAIGLWRAAPRKVEEPLA